MAARYEAQASSPQLWYNTTTFPSIYNFITSSWEGTIPFANPAGAGRTPTAGWENFDAARSFDNAAMGVTALSPSPYFSYQGYRMCCFSGRDGPFFSYQDYRMLCISSRDAPLLRTSITT